MLQRLQTIYLALLILLTIILCSIDIINAISIEPNQPAYKYTLSLFYVTITENGFVKTNSIQWELILIASGVIGLSFLAILKYKNRKKQMLFCKINFILMILLIVVFTAKVYTNIPSFKLNMLMMNSGIGIAIFMLLFYFNWRALALIQKDDELVKSADRIR